MRSRQVRLVSLGLAAATLLAAGAVALRPAALSRATAAEAGDAAIRTLLQERYDVLKTVVDETEAAHRIGKASLAEVAAAKRAARHAELKLCADDDRRAAVLEKMLADAEDDERSAESGFQSARLAHADVLKATAERLKVEIALQRAKSGRR